MDSLPIEDVRAIVQLLGEAVDPALGGDVASMRRRVMNGLSSLVQADAWVWAQARLDRSAMQLSYFSYIDGGWSSPEQRAIAFSTEYAEEPREIERRLLAQVSTHVTRTRAQLMDDQTYYASQLYHRFRAPAELDDFIFSYYPVGNDIVSGMGLHRSMHRPQFGDRERCIVHLITSEIDWLHRAGSDVPAADRVGSLSPRLRQVLLQLLAGNSRKQIAAALGISEYTVADHLKALHKHFNVSSRGELMSRFLTGGGPTPSAA